MIVFSPIRSRRLDVRLRELSIGDEMALCHLPDTAHEKALSEFLSRAIESAATPSERHLDDPRAWSVAERYLVLTQYCSHTREDGPDYAITETSTLSGYLDFASDIPAKPAQFQAIGDTWALLPLTGAAAEAIETMQLETDLAGREHWLFGFMAAQLRRNGDVECPNPVADAAGYLEWLTLRMKVMRELPSSAFEELYAAYRVAQDADTQFFRIWFDEQGVIVLPRKEAGAETPPARFLVHACIGSLALALTGKS